MPDPEIRSPEEPGFDLYDLRVEVVGPPDKKIYCGATRSATISIFMERCSFCLLGQASSRYTLSPH